jgi:GTP-binding protein
MMLSSLDERVQAFGGSKHTLQAVITKIDGVPLNDVQKTIRKMREDIFQAAPTCLPPIVTTALKYPYLGVDALQISILEACGLPTSLSRSS